MTTITPLPRRLDGSLDLPGAADITLLDIDFSALTALPSQVTVGGSNGGTGAIAGAPPAAVLRLTTGPSSGNQAFFTLPAVDTSLYEYILFTIDATTPAASYPDQMFVGLEAGSTQGASWRRLDGSLNSRNGDVATIGGPMMGGSGRVSKRQLSMLIIPSKKIVATLDGSGVNNAAIFQNFQGGALLPRVTAQSNSAGAKTLDMRRVRVRVG